MRTVIPCHCLVNLREAAIAQQNQYFLRENTVVQPWGRPLRKKLDTAQKPLRPLRKKLDTAQKPRSGT